MRRVRIKYMTKTLARSLLPITLVLSVAAFGLPAAHAAVGDAVSVVLPTANSAPLGISGGPGDELWIAQSGANRLARMTMAQVVSEIPLEAGATNQPAGLAIGQDGRVWVTMPQANHIAVVTPGTRSVQSFPLPNAGSQPTAIAAGPDGAMWFTERAGNRIGRIAPDGQVTEVALETPNAFPAGITAGSDGAMWFTMVGANAIGRITPGGVVSSFTIPTPLSEPMGITLGPDQNLWFTMPGANSVGRLTPAGAFAQFTLPTPNSRPLGIAVGADGNLWIGQSGARRVARVTPTGGVSEFVLPDPDANPTGITAGSDGNIWTSSPATNRIYRILTGIVPVSVGVPVVTGPGTSVGQVLNASQGIWRFVPTNFAYEWQRCGTAQSSSCSSIPNARSATYALTQSDAGQLLRVLVTATNANGVSIAAVSAQSRIDDSAPVPVTPAPPAPSVPSPIVSGQSAAMTNGVTVTLRGPDSVRRGLKRSYAVVFSDVGVRGKVRIVLTNARGTELRVIAKGRQIRPSGRAGRKFIMPPRMKARNVTLRATFTPSPAQRNTYPTVTLSKPLRILR